MVNKVYLALGANRGNPLQNLIDACKIIDSDNKCSIIRSSSVYESKPYGYTQQNNFYNAVIFIETGYNLEQLFNFIKDIEKIQGRDEQKIHWGPREIDIDILYYNNLIYTSDILTVPHKEIIKRDFVLIPLIEICGDFLHPTTNEPLNKIDISLLEQNVTRKLDNKLI